MIDWALDIDMQQRANLGPNKGETHHALKNALRIGRQGEIRDRTSEAQHSRITGLNLLAAVTIYWNTEQLGRAVQECELPGFATPLDLLRHISCSGGLISCPPANTCGEQWLLHVPNVRFCPQPESTRWGETVFVAILGLRPRPDPEFEIPPIFFAIFKAAVAIGLVVATANPILAALFILACVA